MRFKKKSRGAEPRAVVPLRDARAYARMLLELLDLGEGIKYESKLQDFDLASASVDASRYSDPDSFSQAYLAAEFFSKYRKLDLPGVDTREAALKKFWEAEAQCKETNLRLRRARVSGDPLNMTGLIIRACSIVGSIVGPNPFNALGSCRWTTGASSSIPRRRAQVDNKMTELPFTCSRSAWPYFKRELENDPAWFERLAGTYPSGPYSVLGKYIVEFREWNKVQVTDKNAKTGRTIAAENTANLFLQKSVHRYLRSRLKRHGIDLGDQTINQSMAAAAYHWGYATVDFSMASDTDSIECVNTLFPVDWVNLLDDLRSKMGKAPHKGVFRYEKFSSMGNAFTFELESIIFYALARAVADEDGDPRPVFVYGDDVLLPESLFWRFSTVCSYMGFSVNTKKTHFGSDPLRESCGEHFWKGYNVTPFYQKTEVDCVFEEIRFANRLLRYAVRAGSFPALAIWEEFIRERPWLLKYSGPYRPEGDDYLVNLDELSYADRPHDRNHGVKVKTLLRRKKRGLADEHALYAYALRRHSPRKEWKFAVDSDSEPVSAVSANSKGGDAFENAHTVDLDEYRDIESSTWVIPRL